MVNTMSWNWSTVCLYERIMKKHLKQIARGAKCLPFILDESWVEAGHMCKPLCQEGRAGEWCWFGGLEESIMGRRGWAFATLAGFADMSSSADAAVLLPRWWAADGWSWLPCIPGPSASLLVPSAGSGTAAWLQGGVLAPSDFTL